MKPGVTCVVGQQEAATIAVLEQRARAIDAPLFVCGRDWTFQAAPNGFRYEDEAGARPLPKPSLHAAHQFANSALPVACPSPLSADPAPVVPGKRVSVSLHLDGRRLPQPTNNSY